MNKISKKPKTILTITISSLIIVFALLGFDWQSGQADVIFTTTIPLLTTYEPKEICVYSDDTLVSASGEKYIDVDYTWILWKDASDNFSYIIPNFVNEAGTELEFTVDAAKLTQVYDALFWIENHPPNSLERTGPFYIDIVACNFIYLPLVMK